jgi:hypothetical protein
MAVPCLHAARQTWFGSVRVGNKPLVDRMTSKAVVAVARRRKADLGRPTTFSHLHVSVSLIGDWPQANRKQYSESTRLSASIVLRLRAFRLIPAIDLMLRRM